MEAFHSFWSKPNRYRSGGPVRWEEFELLAMILSALKWQEHNGPVRMLTDEAGAEFFEKKGLTGLWEGGVDTCLEKIPARIDPVLFWAAGKLWALRQMKSPCVMLDTDLIVWRDVRSLLNGETVAAHREELTPEVYPDPRSFHMLPGYSFPAEWDFSVPAANTAFLYLPEEDFKNSYTEAAFDFMEGINPRRMNPIAAMCFAEQRILPMHAKARGMGLRFLLEASRLDGQDLATHLWGYKRRLRQSEQEQAAFCARCAGRLSRDYPQKAFLWESVQGR